MVLVLALRPVVLVLRLLALALRDAVTTVFEPGASVPLLAESVSQFPEFVAVQLNVAPPELVRL